MTDISPKKLSTVHSNTRTGTRTVCLEFFFKDEAFAK